MAKRFEFLDEWFAERGYQRFYNSEPVYRKEVRPGVILELMLGVSTLGRMDDYGVNITYDTCLKPLAALHRKLLTNITRLTKVYPGVAGYVLKRTQKGEQVLEWALVQHSVEKYELGPMWQSLLDTIDPGLVVLEQELIGAEKIADLHDRSHWRIQNDGYSRILVSLFDGDADTALELVDALTPKDVNPAGLSTDEGCLTPEEEVVRAQKLVREYITKNKKKFQR